MINAIAVDDEPMALDVISMHAQKVPFVNLERTFLNAAEALKYTSKQPVDLIFLDISMPDISGLEVAEMLRHKVQVIFTTAYAEHALKGFDLAATDYLLKPVNFQRFFQACKQAEARQAVPVENHTDRSLFVKDGHNWLQIKHADIIYAEAQDNYVCLYEHNRRTLTRITMGDLQQKLPAQQFVRIHKSYLVPLSRIEKIERHQVTVAGIKLPLGNAWKDQLMAMCRTATTD